MKPTIKALQQKVADLEALNSAQREREATANAERRNAQARAEETQKQFSDLKRRLHESEVELARLRGYLARVREDDIVREELVAVGDPAGAQRLVPKRKPALDEPPLFTGVPDRFEHHGGFGLERSQPKHWIEY